MGSLGAIATVCKFDVLSNETGIVALDIYPRIERSQQPHVVTQGPIKHIWSVNKTAQFVIENLEKTGCFIKLLLPTIGGYVADSDFLSRRLVDCDSILEIESFVSPGQHVEAMATEDVRKLDPTEMFTRAIGAIVIPFPCSKQASDKAAELNRELERRLSFPWLSTKPIPRRRLALISPPAIAGIRWVSIWNAFAATAASLNISLVMFGKSDHWLADAEWAHLRDDFIPLDLTWYADHTAQDIASAVSAYPKTLHGITTTEEPLLADVAKAASLLGFSGPPPESVAVAMNKYETRLRDPDIFCRRVRSPADMDTLFSEARTTPITYPLIVKPARGWASEGVYKVDDEDALRNAVGRLWQSNFTNLHGRDVVIESYIEGPEVDANMVLVDGKVVWLEVNDDFPSEADSDNAAAFADFMELSNMIPSALPESELDLLRRELHAKLLDMGFRNGIFHIEARVRNSACRFAVAESGLVDLIRAPKKGAGIGDKGVTTHPEVFLLEVNARAPGIQEVEAVARAYGVCYRSIMLLSALGEQERIQALSVPFVDGAQYHVNLVFVSAQNGGVYDGGDVCEAVLERQPKLRKHVVQSMSYLRKGQVVPNPKTTGFNTWIAFFLVVSRESRPEALRVGNTIRELTREYLGDF